MKKTIYIFTIVSLLLGIIVGCNKTDSMEIFEVSEEWMYGYGNDLAFIKHNGKYYAIGDATDINTFNSYGIGWKRDDINVTGLFFSGGNMMENTTIFSLGDFDLPVFNSGDTFYSGNEELTFQPVEYIGYGVPLFDDEYDPNKFYCITDFSKPDITEINLNNLPISSTILKGEKSGNKGVCGYEKNEKVDYYAYDNQGNTLYDISLIANCKWYKTSNDSFTIKGTTSSDYFNQFDLSSLPSGAYLINEKIGLIMIN